MLVVGNSGRIAWTANASETTPTWSVNTTATTNTLLGAQMLDANHWIVVGDNETILRTADAGATWTGVNKAQPPSVAFTSPQIAHTPGSADISVEGTSSDGRGIGVAKVQIRVQRGAEYWDAGKKAWVASADTWIDADQTDAAQGWDAWRKTVTLPSAAEASSSLTVWARATDGLGLSGNVPSIGAPAPSTLVLSQSSVVIGYRGTATVSGTLRSGGLALASAHVTLSPASSPYAASFTTDVNGNFSFTVAPGSKTTYTLTYPGDAQHTRAEARVTVVPGVKLTTPVVPSTVTHTRSFKTRSDLYPKHASGGRITFIFQRYLKVSGHYKWVTKKTVSARTGTYRSWSRATVSTRLAAGKWRVQAKHSDSDHATSYSSHRTFRIR